MVFINMFKNFKNQISNKLIIKGKREWACLVNHSAYGMYNYSTMYYLTGISDSSETIINIHLYICRKMVWSRNEIEWHIKCGEKDRLWLCYLFHTNWPMVRIIAWQTRSRVNCIHNVDRGLCFIYERGF